jgi:hypothetical protein
MVSNGVMQEQDFLISHPCKMRDSRKKWSLKSCKKYHCETMQDLVPIKTNKTKGRGGYDPQKGEKSQPFGFLPLITGPKLLFCYVY